MAIVEHSKCEDCGKVRNVSELKDKPSGIGMVCVDPEIYKNNNQ